MDANGVPHGNARRPPSGFGRFRARAPQHRAAHGTADDLVAKQAIEPIGELHAVEKEAKARGLDAEGPHALRLEHSVPILDATESWLELAETRVLPKSKMAEAISHARRQWRALRAFLGDGRLEPDNNAASAHCAQSQSARRTGSST